MEERARNLLIFQTSGMDCALPVESVREIVPMAMLSEPPGLPSGMAGFLNLRGVAIPIVHLDRLFNLPEQRPGLNTPMIVLRGVLGPVGILVHYVRSIVDVSPEQLLDIPHDRTFGGCAVATVQLDGDMVQLLSPAALLQANEERMLADYCVMEQARLSHMEAKN